MRLLSVNSAKAIYLGPVRDLNPKGINLYPELIAFLVDTYKFKKSPSMQESIDLNSSNGIIFGDGEFKTEEENDSVVITFTIFNDGLVAESISSTRHSESFLIDAFQRFSSIFKIPPLDFIVKRKLYLSQLFVQTDREIRLLNPDLEQISRYLNKNVEHSKPNFQVGGISFWADQTSKVPPTAFTFERAVGAPFSDNRYYSAAPLQTDQHIELLEKLESILS